MKGEEGGGGGREGGREEGGEVRRTRMVQMKFEPCRKKLQYSSPSLAFGWACERRYW